MTRKKWMREVNGGRVFTVVPVKFNLDMDDILGLLAAHSLSEANDLDLDEPLSERRLLGFVNDQLRSHGGDRSWTWMDGEDVEDVEDARQWAEAQARRVWPVPYRLHKEAEQRRRDATS